MLFNQGDLFSKNADNNEGPAKKKTPKKTKYSHQLYYYNKKLVIYRILKYEFMTKSISFNSLWISLKNFDQLK